MVWRLLAAALFLLLLWSLFRFAMALRWTKVSREEERRQLEAAGRRVVVEVPTESGELAFFLESGVAFHWAGREVSKGDIEGARTLLNGAVLASFTRDGAALPGPEEAEEDEGRERWEVVLHLRGGERVTVPCGALREGVSREIAGRVYEAVRRAVS
jgi:hypothetical protein